MPHPIIPTRLIVLVAVVLAVLIAACGTDVESTPPAGEPQGAATATASAPTAAAQTRPAPPAKPAADARSSLTELTDASWAFLQMLTNEFSPRESATDEERVAADFLVSELEALGHAVDIVEGWTAPFGNVQAIWQLPNGVFRTGADMRREGATAAY